MKLTHAKALPLLEPQWYLNLSVSGTFTSETRELFLTGGELKIQGIAWTYLQLF
jgi:hypothetical protein